MADDKDVNLPTSLEIERGGSLEYANRLVEGTPTPATVKAIFLETVMDVPSVTEVNKRKIEAGLAEVIHGRVDKNTGLVDVSVLEKRMENRIFEIENEFEKIMQASPSPEQLKENLIAQLPAVEISDRPIKELVDQIMSSDDDNELKFAKLRSLYTKGQLSRLGIISIDLVKLKSANSFWIGKVEGQGSLAIVDKMGYDPLGWVLQTISAESGSEEYSIHMDQQIELDNWRNPGKKVQLTLGDIRDTILAGLDPEELNYLKTIKFTPARRGKSGDEFYAEIEKVGRDENNRPAALTEKDMGKFNTLLQKMSKITVGRYLEGEKGKIQEEINDLFGKNNPVTDKDNLDVVLELRAGGAIGARLLAQESMEADEAFSFLVAAADERMEASKKVENIRLIYQALGPGIPRETKVLAALSLAMLKQQDRFPGDPNAFKQIINSDQYDWTQLTFDQAKDIYLAIEQRQTERAAVQRDARTSTR